MEMLGLRLWQALGGWWGLVIVLSAYGLLMGFEWSQDFPVRYRLGTAVFWALAISGFMVVGLLCISSAMAQGR